MSHFNGILSPSHNAGRTGEADLDYRIVYAGAQAVCGALFLTLLYLRHANDRVQRINKLDVLYCLFLITIVLDAIWIFIDGRPEYRIGHIVLEVVYLSAMAVVGYLWFLYSLDFLPAKTMALRKYRFILAIPVIAEIIIVISSVNTGLIFTVDEGGHYIRGSLSIPAVLLHYAYMLLGSYVALHCRKEA
ncbi:MAG: hypothetical protein IJ131_11330, partial [Eggerthellaceae bacterium]|nr:hypothetical protein [Eggerthellaceae bacterium]